MYGPVAFDCMGNHCTWLARLVAVSRPDITSLLLPCPSFADLFSGFRVVFLRGVAGTLRCRPAVRIRTLFGRASLPSYCNPMTCCCTPQMGQSVQQAFDSAKTVVSNTSDALCAAEHSKFALLGNGDHNQRLFAQLEKGGLLPFVSLFLFL
jgi:hypothetical protein